MAEKVEPDSTNFDVRVSTLELGGEELKVLSVPLIAADLPELSPAEREVVELAVQGKSNAEIADARGTAVRTVANQLSSVFSKLQLSSRSELVRTVFEAQLRSDDPQV